MKETPYSDRTPVSLEENLKKALTELLILSLLAERERYIGELTPEIEARSGGAIHIEFPYSAIYRISRAGYITECKKRIAPDGRLRQYYRITEAGNVYLRELEQVYSRFISGVFRVLQKEDESDGSCG